MKLKLITATLLLISFFAFTVLGIYIEKTPTDTKEILTIWSWLTSLGTILAGVGTVIASYAAVLALDNWKKQSKGVSSINRLLANQENVAILCCEFLDRTTSVMGEERNEFYLLAKKTEDNFSILSRQIFPNTELLEMNKLLFMPKVKIRDSGLMWDNEKQQLHELEKKLNQFIKEQ